MPGQSQKRSVHRVLLIWLLLGFIVALILIIDLIYYQEIKKVDPCRLACINTLKDRKLIGEIQEKCNNVSGNSLSAQYIHGYLGLNFTDHTTLQEAQQFIQTHGLIIGPEGWVGTTIHEGSFDQYHFVSICVPPNELDCWQAQLKQQTLIKEIDTDYPLHCALNSNI